MLIKNQLLQQQQKTTIIARMMIQVQLSSKRWHKQLLFIRCIPPKVFYAFCGAHLHLMRMWGYVTQVDLIRIKIMRKRMVYTKSKKARHHYYNSVMPSLFLFIEKIKRTIRVDFLLRRTEEASQGRLYRLWSLRLPRRVLSSFLPRFRLPELQDSQVKAESHLWK